jgi:hypothetical protein
MPRLIAGGRLHSQQARSSSATVARRSSHPPWRRRRRRRPPPRRHSPRGAVAKPAPTPPAAHTRAERSRTSARQRDQIDGGAVPVPSRRARRDITPREPVCCGRMAQMMWRGVWPPRAPPRHACRHPVLRRASGSHAAAADQQLDSVVRGHGHLQRGDRPAQPLQVVVPDRGRCVSILLDANGRYVGNLSQGGRQ